MFYRTPEEFKSANGYEVEGLWYPRVTAIVSIKAKPGLYRFYAEQENFEAGEAIKTRSAEEGTLIHDTVEAVLAGRQPVIPENISPALIAFANLCEHNKIIAHRLEDRLVNRRYRYSGTLDVLAEINGRTGILDIKTSYSIFRDYGLQTAAYMEAVKESEPSSPLSARWILRLDQYQQCQKCQAVLRTKGGRDKVRKTNGPCEHQWGEVIGEAELKELPFHQKDFKAFLACKTLWEWENDFWLKKILNPPFLSRVWRLESDRWVQWSFDRKFLSMTLSRTIPLAKTGGF